MKKEDFLFLLLGASYAAYKFAQLHLIDDLPTDFRYDVQLNSSTDDPRLTQFDIYPEDNGRVLKGLTDKEVIGLLCRQDKVPVWIDISVDSVWNGCTVFRLLSAGRYSSVRKEFYYEKGGSGPFGIKSPILPIDYKEGIKFNLESRDIIQQKI